MNLMYFLKFSIDTISTNKIYFRNVKNDKSHSYRFLGSVTKFFNSLILRKTGNRIT